MSDARPPSRADRHLFVAGCPRSGTSALAFLLNEHPEIVLGFERYKRVRGLVDPFHFEPEQFFSPVAAETDVAGRRLYVRLRERWDGGGVRVIGDKVPLYTRALRGLLDRFDDSRVAVLVRDPYDVARSFQARAADPGDWWPAENDHRVALDMWNEALARVREAEERGDGARVLLVPYEPLFAGDPVWLDRLAAFVGVAVTERLRAEHSRLASRWQERAVRDREPELAAYVEAHRDAELNGWAQQRMAQGPTDGATTGPAGVAEAPLSADEVAERERERDELLAEMRSAGERDRRDAETLERRFIAQSEQLTRQGDRVRALGLTAVTGLPDRRRRVTFVTPHQRATSGGVYAIEQHARALARLLDVTLLVRAGECRSIPGVRVRPSPELDAATVPDADVVVYPADMADAAAVLALPPQKGRPVLYFQGFGTPGSSVVEANLAVAGEAVASARWLVDVADAAGVACVHVPYGLDRNVFAPGPPSAERGPVVTMMTHRLDWKGLEDGLEAVALVRAARPDAEPVLFGVEPVDGVGTFHLSPSRDAVAELLRASAVHIVSSWEEGFGMPGAEALACGAALATADTKGSRDYAVHDRTALVSPPREPRLLAEHVLALLDDPVRRSSLTAAGQRHVHRVLPSWAEAGRRLAQALFDDL
jgi:glycosyltransferase involved in cell wall biosynthesis